MNLNLIAAAEQATPLLMESAKNGTLNEELFMDILKMQRAALSDADWLMLLVTLLAMTPNPVAVPLARIASAPAAAPLAHGLGLGVQQ